MKYAKKTKQIKCYCGHTITCDCEPLETKQEIVGYRLKPSIDKMMVDGILKYAMPIWNDKDKSIYFIRGHVAGSLVSKIKQLQVLDLWFTPIYENEEIESNWIKKHHIDYYKKEGMMADIPKQETLEEAAERLYPVAIKPILDKYDDGVTNQIGEEDVNEDNRESFIQGANWQAERMYNEKDLKEAFETGKEMDNNHTWVYSEFEDWFKQFKKK